MIGEQITCENAGCEVVFTKKTHNQRYHDSECTRIATNAQIMRKYYEKRARELGLARYCVDCESKLSRYNTDIVCNACTLKRDVNKNNSVASMLTSNVVA